MQMLRLLLNKHQPIGYNQLVNESYFYR